MFMAQISLGAGGDTGIKGALKDELGAVIEKATVFISTTPVLSTRTDRNGDYSLTLTADGLYDVFVSAPGFAPTCAKVLVKKHHWTIFSRVLRVDTLTAKMNGDTFDTNPPRLQKH
jgi:hypothetical protein